MNIEIGIDQGPGNLPTTGYEANPTTWLDTDQEYDSVVDEFYRQLEGVGMGLEAISDLIKVNKILAATESTDLRTLKMARVVMNYHQGQLKIPLLAIGKEDITENKEVALEGVGNFLKTIINAIINTLKAIFASIGKLFKSSRKDLSRKNSEESIKNAEEIAKKVSEMVIPGEPITHGMFKFFNYLGKDLDLKDIAGAFEAYHKSVESSVKILDSIKEYEKKLQKGLEQMTKDPIIVESEMMEFIKDVHSGSGSSYNSVLASVRSNFVDLVPRGNYSENLSEIIDRRDLSEKERVLEVHGLHGYMDGKVFGAVIYPNDEMYFNKEKLEELYFHTLETNYTTKVPVTVDFADAKRDYPALIRAMRDIDKVTEDFDKVVKADFGDTRLLESLEKLVTKKSLMLYGEAEEGMFFVKEFTSWIGQLTGLIMVTDQTLLYYRDLFAFIEKKLSPKKKEVV